MRKKAVILWIAGCLFISMAFIGCGPIGQLRNVARAYGGAGDGNEQRAEAEEAAKAGETAAAAKTPVLGGEAISGYEGFSYLYEESLTAYMEEDAENGKIKRKTVTIYVPKGKKSGKNSDFPGTAYADAFGVSFCFSLNPYELSDQKDEPAAKRLQGYMEKAYPGADEKKEGTDSGDYEDLEVSPVRELGKDAASVTVKYCRWNDRKEDYSVIYGTYYLKELQPGLLALLEVEIDSREATSKTPGLLEELEAFYEVDMEWDSGRAQEKLEKYLAGKEDKEIAGMIEFQFPKGWEIDDNYSGEEMVIYAPGGDSDGAGCGIGITNLQAMGYTGEALDWPMNEKYMEMFIQDGLGDRAEGLTVNDYGETCIGKTILAEFAYKEAGETIDCRLYFGRSDKGMYLVVAVQFQWLEMNTFEVVEELLEKGRVE